jgi:hypothetical protein
MALNVAASRGDCLDSVFSIFCEIGERCSVCGRDLTFKYTFTLFTLRSIKKVFRTARSLNCVSDSFFDTTPRCVSENSLKLNKPGPGMELLVPIGAMHAHAKNRSFLSIVRSPVAPRAVSFDPTTGRSVRSGSSRISPAYPGSRASSPGFPPCELDLKSGTKAPRAEGVGEQRRIVCGEQSQSCRPSGVLRDSGKRPAAGCSSRHQSVLDD